MDLSIPYSKIFLGIYLTDVTNSVILLSMAIIKVSAFKCERCGHIWLPRNATDKLNNLEAEKPKVCPKCKSAYWNTPKKPAKIKADKD